jgi:hypothetical protein
MDLKHRTEQHERVGNTYQSWCLAADQLFAAARVLKRQHDTFDDEEWMASEVEILPDEAQVFPPLLMLRGMGLECLLKALWLKQGHEVVRHGKYVGVPNTNQHDLVGLARETGFALSSEDDHLLVRLSDFVTHIGRYPIAKRGQEHLRMLDDPTGGQAMTGSWRSPSDEYLFAGLVARLHRELGW